MASGRGHRNPSEPERRASWAFTAVTACQGDKEGHTNPYEHSLAVCFFSPVNVHGEMASFLKAHNPPQMLLRKLDLRASNSRGSLLLLWPPLCIPVFNNVIVKADSLTRL